MTITKNPGSVVIGGTVIPVVSLVGPDDTQLTAPAIIDGNERRRMSFADPGTGYPVDLLKSLKSVTLSGDYTLTASDHMRDFSCATPLTVTVPGGISPRPTCTFDCPPTGNLSIASSGTTVNGTASTLTRSRTDNPAGVALRGHQDADTYGLSGA